MYVREFSMNNGGLALDAGRRYGIEIEVESARIPDDMHRQSNWSYVEDGSLRNSGLEFVSVPLSEARLDRAINQFYTWFGEHGYSTSIRTSTHVHANVLEHSMEEVGAVLAAYCIVEPILFQLCGQEREENIYCVPWYRAPDQVAVASAAININYRRVNNSCKYSALYLEPMYRFGTLEFRHAPVFERGEDLELWISIVRAIVYGAPTRWENAEAVVLAYEELGCDAFMSTLFGDALAQELSVMCTESFEDLVDNADSIKNAEELVPSLCTYKVTDDQWVVPNVNVDGDGARGYRLVAYGGGLATGEAFRQVWLDEPMDYDEDYDEEEYI